MAETQGADYAIWCVAALLYLFDAARLLAPRELLLIEGGRSRLTAVLSREPFTLAGRVLCFAPLLRPDRGAFVAPWGREWLAAGELQAAIAGIERIRAALGGARGVACAAFLLLFGMGPALTFVVGANAAVVYTAALLYPTVALAIGWLWWRRRRLALTVRHTLFVSVEMAICPALLPNLVRKITATHRLTVDGGQLASATAAAAARPEVLAPFVDRAESLLDGADDDSTESETLQRYLVTLRGHPGRRQP